MGDSSTPLTDQTLQRLRKLATGNGLAPQAIVVTDTEEKVYTFEGVMTFTPLCEVDRGRYPGGARGADRKLFPSFASLQAESERRQKEFKDSTDWVPKVIQELKTEPGEGWGLDGAKITVPEHTVILAATEACPTCQGSQMLTCTQCQGRGEVVCSQCQGRGREHCYQCNGSGHDPVNPEQQCPICQGTREAPCRFCRATGQLPCPTCQGRRGTPCHVCNGTGRITEEISLICGATAKFRLNADGLPSGMRRGFDRLGIANLGKGHADIKMLAEEKKKKEGEPEGASEPDAVLKYVATMPYADIRLRFGDARVQLISAFGKRCSLLNVPPFLDESLKVWREKLQQAARGEVPIEQAIEARAIREALGLQISSKGSVKELRRIYSVGLSPDVATEILKNLRRALNRMTLKWRSAIAVGCGVLSAGLFGGVFLTPLHRTLTQGWPSAAVWGADMGLLLAAMLLGWLALGNAARLALQKRFPDLKIPFQMETGKTGYAMMAGIGVLGWLAVSASRGMLPGF